MTRFYILLLAGILAACGSAPVQHLPPAQEQAQTADKEARRALRSGELLRAQHDFARALTLQQSLDDMAGASMTLINLATVTHQLHDDEAALIWLDKILLEKAPVYPPDSILIAAFRKAVILTNLARLIDAEQTLQMAEKLCAKKCAPHFGIDALRARLLLLNKDAEGALALALTIANAADADKDEQANAWRIIAMAEEKLQRYANSLQHYQLALEMDKSLALSARIVEDLNGISHVLTQLGREQEAAIYARRAALASAVQDTSINHNK